jgi:hypothetical protein
MLVQLTLLYVTNIFFLRNMLVEVVRSATNFILISCNFSIALRYYNPVCQFKLRRDVFFFTLKCFSTFQILTAVNMKITIS